MTLETIPQTADLRAELEHVYNQGPTNECGGWTTSGMVEVWRDRAGLPFRKVSAKWHYQRALEMDGNLGGDPGSGKESLARVLEIGFLFEDQYDPNALPSTLDALATANGRCRVTRVLPYPGNSRLEGIHRSIAMGMPVAICIAVSEGLWRGIGKPDWRTHDPEPTAERNTHWCMAVGYDRTLTHRPTLAEDSSGPDAWDGGFFGLPDAWINSHALVDAWRIEAIEGIAFKPIGGFMPASPPIIPTFERSQMLTAQESIHVGAITALLTAQNVQGVIDYCKTHGVNDKWAAHMFSQPATFMLDFKNANPGLNWDGFPWWPQ